MHTPSPVGHPVFRAPARPGAPAARPVRRFAAACLVLTVLTLVTGCGGTSGGETGQPQGPGVRTPPTVTAPARAPGAGATPQDQDKREGTLRENPYSAAAPTSDVPFAPQGGTGDTPTGSSVDTLVMVLAGVVVLLVAVGLLVWGRRRGRRRGPGSGTVPSYGAPSTYGPVAVPAGSAAPSAPAQATGPVARAGTPSSPDGEPLRQVLALLVERATSPAIAQQAERLLARQPQRDGLIEACVRFRDQLAGADPVLATRIVDALARDGVHAVHADGEAFDPARHEAVGSEPAPAPDRHDRVAETVRPGFRDGTQVVRPPQVVVYREEDP